MISADPSSPGPSPTEAALGRHSPAPSSSPRPNGWPRTSAGRTPHHRRPVAARRHRARAATPPATSRARSTSTGEPTSSTPRRAATCCSSPRPTGWRRSMTAAGIGDGTSLVALRRHRSSYHAARAWWSLRAYGFESARILEGGWPAWVEAGHPIANGEVAAPPATFTPRLQVRGAASRPADVRGLLGAPDVLLVDARGPAEFHGFEGNVRRLGHIPGAVNVPVAAMHQPGHAAPARPGRAALDPAQGEHHPRPAARLLRPVRASRRPSSPGC